MTDKERLKKYKTLVQYKNKTDEEIKELIEKEIEAENIIQSLAFCIDDEEKIFATDLYQRYTDTCSFENEADKDSLLHLIDQELLAARIKKELKKEYEKGNPTIPLQMVDQLDSVIDRIGTLKEKLGLTSQDKQQNSWSQYWNKLEAKCLNYYKEHAAETYTRCPKCQHIYTLLMKVDDKEKISATFFKGTKIYNRKLFSLYHEKRLTEVELAEILGVSSLYINYIYSEVFLSERKND
jgi:hypothetical protein